MTIISNLLFNSVNFCVIVRFFIKLLKFDILFSTAVNAEVVAKPLILGILALILIIFVLRVLLVAKLVI